MCCMRVWRQLRRPRAGEVDYANINYGMVCLNSTVCQWSVAGRVANVAAAATDAIPINECARFSRFEVSAPS